MDDSEGTEERPTAAGDDTAAAADDGVIRVPEPDGGDPYEEGSEVGTFSPDTAVTPGRPHVESVVFVALGAFVGLFALGGIFFGSLLSSPLAVAVLAGVIAVGAALLYGLFAGTNPDT